MGLKTIEGIDVSIYQARETPIDFSAVKSSGVSFVMVRAGWCGYQGEMHFDSTLDRTVQDAVEAGLDVGLYVYSYALSNQAAARAAQETVETAKKYKITYPIALDVEDERLISALSRAQITDTTASFCEEVWRQGYFPMFYTYYAFARSYLNMSALQDYAFWIADYAEKNSYTGAYGIWQYTDAGVCPGVHGPCDRDFSYRDYAAVIRRLGLNGLSSPQGPASSGENTAPGTPKDGPDIQKPSPGVPHTISSEGRGSLCRLWRSAGKALHQLLSKFFRL